LTEISRVGAAANSGKVAAGARLLHQWSRRRARVAAEIPLPTQSDVHSEGQDCRVGLRHAIRSQRQGRDWTERPLPGVLCWQPKAGRLSTQIQSQIPQDQCKHLK
jgi:hypothetical protein